MVMGLVTHFYHFAVHNTFRTVFSKRHVTLYPGISPVGANICQFGGAGIFRSTACCFHRICCGQFFGNRKAKVTDLAFADHFCHSFNWRSPYTWFGIDLIGNAIRRIPASLDEAAALEGISRYRRTQKILIPLIAPSLFAAFIVSFIFCLGEMGTTIMVYPPGTEIMPIKIFTVTANASQALTSSLTLIVFSVTLLMITLFYFAAKPLFNRKTIVDD